MLGYIPDARRLDAVDPNSVTLSTAQSLIDAAQKIDSLGVSHRDYNPGNILFSHGEGIIIDFGGGIVRERVNQMKSGQRLLNLMATFGI